MWPEMSRRVRPDLLRSAARLLALLWAAWWTFFVWADIGRISIFSPGIGVASVISLLLMGSVTVAWQWERQGGAILLIEGMLLLIGYPLLAWPIPLSTLFFLLLVIAAPPLLAGALLLFTPKEDAAVPRADTTRWQR